MYKYINMVGIELEGGWKTAPNYPGLQTDPSVKLDKEDPSGSYFRGEIASKPLRPDMVENFIDTYYPDIHNSTCAMHIHISLRKVGDYIRLMDNNFYSFYMERFKKWGLDTKLNDFHLYWSRLSGYNNFCRDQFRPFEQIVMDKKGGSTRDVRYTQLNYCYTMHKTVECRLFPVFKHKNVAKSAVKEFLACVEEYLSKAPPYESFNLEFSVPKESPEEFLCAL